MSRLSPYLTKIADFIKAHRYPLLVIIVCYAFTQIIIFRQQPLIGPYPDSPSYIDGANIILHHFFDGDILRAYGYSFFLALIFALTGQSTFAVVIVQAILLLLTILEVYVLTYRLTGNKIVATMPAALLAINIYVAQWERMIMTETLVTWVLVTIFLLLARYLSNDRLRLAIVLGVLLGWAVLIRPNYIFLPVLLGAAVVVYHLYQKAPQRAWQRALIIVGIAYALVVGQIAINYTSPNHYLGLSITSDVNLFGKIIEYKMEDGTSDPQYDQLKQDLHQFIAQGGDIPWFFLDTHHQYSIAFVGAFSRAIILHHPVEFLADNLKRDLSDAITILPHAYAGLAISRHIPLSLIDGFAKALFFLYRLIPLLLLVALVLVIRERRQLSANTLLLATLTVFVFATIFFAAIGNYGNQGYVEYYRLRFPADWALLLVMACMAFIGINTYTAWRARSQAQQAPAEDTDATLKRPALRSPARL